MIIMWLRYCKVAIKYIMKSIPTTIYVFLTNEIKLLRLPKSNACNMQISFECVSIGVLFKHGNLDLECIIRDSCLYLFFVIIGKSSIQISFFWSFPMNQQRSIGISKYSLEIFQNLNENKGKAARPKNGINNISNQ